MKIKKYFNGKNAVITGAASGIGKSIAINLARLGSNLVLSDINVKGLEQVKKEIESFGVKVIAVNCDVTKQTDVKDLAETSISEMADIHFLFSNAGIFMGGPFEFFSINQWKKIINVNILGMIHAVQAFIPKMIEQEFGHVIVTSSIAGSMGSGAVLAYSTTKFANSGFCEALYGEFKGRGIDVSIICPFPIKTNLIENYEFAFPPNLFEKLDADSVEIGKKAAKRFYWNEFTKKSGPFMGFCGGFEIERAINRILKKISKKKLYVFDRRYGRFFVFWKGFWPGIYKFFLKLSGKRHVELIDQTFKEAIKTAKQ
ncbi:MAG: SDR family NAD(P)-dependent oxidoreductase [Promethearchaeota archaeon]